MDGPKVQDEFFSILYCTMGSRNRILLSTEEVEVCAMY